MPVRHGSDGERARAIALVCLAATVAGSIFGVVGAAFRWCLQAAEGVRAELVEWALRLPGPGWLIPIAAAAACATIAGLLVRWEPQAVGSGIPHVEAVFLGEARPPRISVLPARFVGGALAIGAGLVLGREGPTVHMGAAVGAEAARRTRMGNHDARAVEVALAGAGLAVAFNAPIAGVLFTLEEVTKSLRLRVVLPTVLAATAAIVVSRLLLGNHPDFEVGRVAAPDLAWLPLFVVFGVLTGVFGAGYNVVVLWLGDHVAALPKIPALLKATAIGAVIGAALCVAPLTVGDGDSLTQMILDGHQFVLWVALGLLAARFFSGPLSYSAAVPGGLFAPLLALGALWGFVFTESFAAVWPDDARFLAVPMAIVGMTAFFGASVRAPLTGIAIVIEMTATTSVAIPAVAATVSALLTARALGSVPIYDSLRKRMPAEPDPNQLGGSGRE
ncbi:ClC family H(+)/Cl(-) exchange transporter [Mycolicibacterium sp. BiH015]|uniref:ClC family H(+)/Cl(-) exchange transporter n=1 Tax=Mycolicibacterium sp. BiH015 TaxID=3018808 RepID=UPI0022E4153F|nr:ClC family H(+)/Cl(-) exchange transporter [Mycolicibacterium sp. BiH015]MDA2892646.1 ClC family H(+)/Cl(-) exchange transporter [Mycolicibacterium sp. BiH015]